MDLAHVTVSMLDGKPSKVQCKTCKGTHKYKLGSGSTSSGPRKTRTAAPKTVIRAAELWEQKLSQKTGDAAPYQTSRKFAAGEVLNHPNFGMGIVEEIRGNKVLVLFREGEKILVHGMGAP